MRRRSLALSKNIWIDEAIELQGAEDTGGSSNDNLFYDFSVFGIQIERYKKRMGGEGCAHRFHQKKMRSPHSGPGKSIARVAAECART